MSVIKFVIWVTAAYFIGNISPSILLGKAKGVDIKKEGSGNAGTTKMCIRDRCISPGILLKLS